MNIVHFETNEEDRTLLEATSAQQEQFAHATVRFETEKLTLDTVAAASDAEIISVFVGSAIGPEILDQLPNLKLLITRSTGFDHIAMEYAKQKGITVANIPAYGSRTVAEFAFTLMLGLARKAFQASFHIKAQEDFNYAGFEGFNLQGKTLGVLGTGRIGQEVIKIAKGFEMNVLAFDAYPNTDAATALGFTYADLPTVLGRSDIVTIHVPYNDSTHHMLTQAHVSQFKKGCILINTSRGEVIETEAILQGVQQKIFAGVGLDVLEGERELKDEMELALHGGNVHQEKFRILLEDHMLMKLPEVVITPHMAFYTKEAKQEIITATIQIITSYLQNHE